jgi:hypothetical protein
MHHSWSAILQGLNLCVDPMRHAQRGANALLRQEDNNGAPNNAPTKPLRVMTLNTHGVKKKSVELHHLLRSQKVDVIALQCTDACAQNCACMPD